MENSNKLEVNENELDNISTNNQGEFDFKKMDDNIFRKSDLEYENSTVTNPQCASEVSVEGKNDIQKRDKQNQNILGKFKNVETLAKAYTNLQAEFTRKSQLLKEFERQNIDNLSNKTDTVRDKTDLVEEFDKAVKTQNDEVKNCKENDKCLLNNEETVENTQKNEEKAQKSDKSNDFLENKEIDLEFNQKNLSNLKKSNELEKTNSDLQENFIELQLKELIETNTISKDMYKEIANELLENDALLKSNNAVVQVVLKMLNEHSADYNQKINDSNFILDLALNNKQVHDKIIQDYVDRCQRDQLPRLITKSIGANILASTPSVPTTLSEAGTILEKWLKK